MSSQTSAKHTPLNRRTSSESSKRLNAIVSYSASVFVACVIIMWSVFNTQLNILLYFRANPDDQQAWGVTACLVMGMCVIPFALGLVLLAKTLGISTDKSGAR